MGYWRRVPRGGVMILTVVCTECGDHEEVEVEEGDTVSLDLFTGEWTESEDGSDEYLCEDCANPLSFDMRVAQFGGWGHPNPARALGAASILGVVPYSEHNTIVCPACGVVHPVRSVPR
jgi:hypothetical protein